ncbi:hypothetical protein [Bacillus sp. 1P02SD]|uniref:hypothetical protein n=1 Tax=Bacillus sp. 1P02SD TaxID=3132264 RepID=UPI0039A0D084
MDVSYVVERIDSLINVTNKEIYSSDSGITYQAEKSKGPDPHRTKALVHWGSGSAFLEANIRYNNKEIRIS